MTTAPTPIRLCLEEDMTIYNAAALKDRLLSALAAADEVELDLSRVAEIDSAGTQLLILAKRESLRLGKSLRLVAHSAAVRDLLDFFDIVAFFGDPLHIPAGARA